MTEYEKMVACKIYDPSDQQLANLRARAHKMSKDYNDTYEYEFEKRNNIISALLPHLGKNSYIQGPIQFDYGINTFIGERCYFNFNLTILDCAKVIIGNDVFFGPNVMIATPIHPMLFSERKFKTKEDGRIYDLEYAKEIHIGNGTWIASNVVIIGGVRIGDNVVIGAGSVVTKDIPSNHFAAGNPCKVIRKITDEDSIYLKKELF